jgi:hypothetical protein
VLTIFGDCQWVSLQLSYVVVDTEAVDPTAPEPVVDDEADTVVAPKPPIVSKRVTAAKPRPSVVSVSVLIDFQTLTGVLAANGICELFDGTPISPDTVRRLACDAAIIPMVLGSRGEVLNQGRRIYAPTMAQRHAVAIRDRHCASPDAADRRSGPTCTTSWRSNPAQPMVAAPTSTICCCCATNTTTWCMKATGDSTAPPSTSTSTDPTAHSSTTSHEGRRDSARLRGT